MLANKLRLCIYSIVVKMQPQNRPGIILTILSSSTTHREGKETPDKLAQALYKNHIFFFYFTKLGGCVAGIKPALYIGSDEKVSTCIIYTETQQCQEFRYSVGSSLVQ